MNATAHDRVAVIHLPFSHEVSQYMLTDAIAEKYRIGREWSGVQVKNDATAVANLYSHDWKYQR